ncbi:hypothetical protein LX64_03895 [Chitinophaga skermanii]|uniref:NACHT domain-containing protein n=1 Tax=Chitinophaga skermanii TaxID=331697 RepID=A0A327QIY8_9BACT|nr:hypothetical protein [Chitinophaga skermanii]RAJ01677.1 hypothetical protein LX64_03895 [Chitinophaga skermanii]
MIDLSYDFIVTLQNEVVRTFGADLSTPAMCKELSKSILNKTTKHVSETTLKRVFGFAIAQHSFSRYTLNTLAFYCGFKDWDTFQNHHYPIALRTPQINEEFKRWTEVKTKATAVSQYTLQTLKNRSGINFQHTVPRQHTLHHIERFLESNYAATVFIAPAGWGKSLSLVHATEHFWFGPKAVYQNDVCWFIHAHAAGSLLMKGFSLATWLDNQMNLGKGENFREYFSRHINEKGGRLVLIIDGFDEINLGAEKTKVLYSKLEDFVYSNDAYPWIKVILSIRSSTWSEVFQQSHQYPSFRRFWYLGQEMDDETNINMPLMTEQEVKSILYNNKFDPATVRQFTEAFIQKLRHPYYLQLFCQLNDAPAEGFIDENLSLFEITSKFVQNKVFNSNTNNFKIEIIDKLLELLDYGRNGMYTEKTVLLNKNATLFSSYKELVGDNILVEENLSQEIMFNVKVRFAHNFLLEYFTAMHYYQQANQYISEELIRKILALYPHSSFRISLFKWLLRCALNNDQVSSIQSMFQLELTSTEKAHLLEYMVMHHQRETQQAIPLNVIFPPGFFKKNPISQFINDDFIHFKKRRVLNTLLNLSESSDDKLKIRSNLFVMAFMQLDAEQCELELANIRKLCNADESMQLLWMTPYEAFLFIYEYLKFGVINPVIKEKLYNYVRMWDFNTSKKFSIGEEIVCKAICFAFLILGDYKQLLHFTQRMFQRYPTMLFSKADPFRLMLLCWEAQSHIRVGELKEAKRLSEHIDKVLKQYSTDFLNGKHLDTLQKIIAAEISFYEKDYSRAIRLAESAMEMAHKLDFKMFALLNYNVLNKIYRQLQMEPQKLEAIHKVEMIRKSTTFKQVVPSLVGE